MFFCFDTSAVNALHDDADSTSVIAGIRASGMLRPTEFNVMEIIQTKNVERRHSLLRLLGNFLDGALPLTLPTLIIRRIARARGQGCDYFSTAIGNESRDVLRALKNPDLIDKHSRAVGQRWSRYVNGEFDAVAVSMREAAQAARKEHEQPWMRSASALLRYQMFNPGEHYMKFGALMYFLENRKRPTNDELQSVLQHQAWKLLFGGSSVALHRRSMRTKRYSASRWPGGADLSQAVYLAFCDVFVTEDVPQHRVLRLLRVLAGRGAARVMRYQTFRAQFCR